MLINTRSSLLFSMVIAFFVLVPVKSVDSPPEIIERITNGTIPSKSPSPNITIIANVTQQVSLTLVSAVETIVFNFLADPYYPGDYRLIVTNNDKIKSSQTAQFPNGQVITLSLVSKKFTLTGNDIFRISQPVASKQYNFVIREQLAVDTNTTISSPHTTVTSKNINAGNALYILAGILGGLFAVVVIVKVVVTVANRKKRAILPQVSLTPTATNERLARLSRQMNMTINVSPLPNETVGSPSPGMKESINLDEKMLSDQETEYLHPYGYKKETPNSISSIDNTVVRAATASTLSKLSPSSGSLSTVSRSTMIYNSKSDVEEARKNKRNSTMDPKHAGYQHGDIQLKVAVVPELEAIKEESSPQRKVTEDKPAEMLTFGLEVVRAKEKASTSRKGSKYQVSPFDADLFKEEPRSHRSSKKFSFEQNHTRSTVISRTIFSEDNMEERENKEVYAKRFKPRHKMIKQEQLRNIVDNYLKEQEQQKLNFNDQNDYSSSEEEDNDQFQLPNYTCCMICLGDRRNIVMQPCQHIFACKSCSKKVMNTSKICLLCSGDIKRAHKLKN